MCLLYTYLSDLYSKFINYIVWVIVRVIYINKYNGYCIWFNKLLLDGYVYINIYNKPFYL